MKKIKNKILIYFIFYINNISFLTNEEDEKILTETQIQENNDEEIIPKNKFKDKENNWLIIILIFSGMSLLLIFLFIFYKIYKEKNKKTTEEEIERIKKETETIRIEIQKKKDCIEKEKKIEKDVLEENKKEEEHIKLIIEKIKFTVDYLNTNNIDLFLYVKDIHYLNENNGIHEYKIFKILKESYQDFIYHLGIEDENFYENICNTKKKKILFGTKNSYSSDKNKKDIYYFDAFIIHEDFGFKNFYEENLSNNLETDYKGFNDSNFDVLNNITTILSKEYEINKGIGESDLENLYIKELDCFEKQ